MTQSQIQHEPDYLDRLINEQEAAKFMNYSVRALQNWRVRGGGPPYIRISSRSIRYRRRDVIAWTEGRLERNTSEYQS